ncbi:MAG: sigma-70 family RNA polymerase sigma factor [Clostridia bacterium]|nr:sigma-70 family RNA polymerase sigma factor [Clostridia bacterium]
MLVICLSVINTEADKSKFNKLYDTHEGLMRKAALYYMKGDAHRAEDALQDAWLYVAERIESLKFSEPKAERGYLLTVLRYRALAIYNRQRTENDHVINFEDIDEFYLSEWDTPENALCEKELYQRTADLICSMSQMDRDILWLTIGLERSVKESAEIMGISENAARMRLHHARVRLEKRMKEEHIFNE